MYIYIYIVRFFGFNTSSAKNKSIKVCKETKKNQRKTDFMLRVLKAAQTVGEASQSNNDTEMISLTTDKLIGKEANYHTTWYRSYTLTLSKPTKDINKAVQQRGLKNFSWIYVNYQM